jgi:hypothetical protein
MTLTDQNIKNNYIKKIQDRYNKNDYFFEDSDEIFKCIINKLETHYKPTLAGVIHGDFWFSNIILDYDDNIKLIDMKGQVDGILSLNGDIYYDYGKLLQSVLGYDLIINDCVIDDNYINFIQEYFFQKCKDIQLDIEFLKVVTLSFLFSNIYFIDTSKKLKVWAFIKKLI